MTDCFTLRHLSRMAQDGFAAYDCSITQPVLVQSVVLCFLADSPMHAEVTNTPNPGQSNHPCRMCTLSVERKSMIKTMAHVQSYLQVDGHGQEVCPTLLVLHGTLGLLFI
jgi:hypothetical protein